ncbi:MAG: hypothetical protein ACLTZT_20660 [Butyricimonas faecalis]
MVCKNIYAGDVEFTNILRQISVEFQLPSCAHAHQQGKHDDDIGKISGSEGMAGGTDETGCNKEQAHRHQSQSTISNRDTEAFEFALI